MRNKSAAAWWDRVKTTAPSDVAGLWFGLTELGGGWHLYVAGTRAFDADDETAEWAVGPYLWWPEDRYLALAEIANLATPDAVQHASELVRALAPWREIPVHGVAVGFDDGDFDVVYDAGPGGETA